MIKAVLFDLDGTLVDSLVDLGAAVDYALLKLGFPTHTLAEYQYFVGNGIPRLIERSLPENARDGATKKKCLDIFLGFYQEHSADKSYAYKGMPALVEEIKRRGYKTAVISNKAQDLANDVVISLVGDHFDIICGKREDYPAKPDPALTLKVIDELGVTPDECVFVGDSDVDMKTAVNSGTLPIGVLWGYRTKEEIISNGARYTVNTPDEIMDILEKLQ